VDKILEILAVFGEIAKPLGGFAKALELAAACLTLIVSIVALRRIKKSVSELKATADDVTNSLEAKMQSFKAEFSELADSINDQFVSTRQIPTQQASVDASLANWNEIRGIWRAARERVEAKVLSITDGRVRKKYASKDWRDFADILNSLEADKKLSPNARVSGLEMYSKFNSMRLRQAQIRADEVVEFARLAHRFGLKGMAPNSGSNGDDSQKAVSPELELIESSL
jgi:hypothetical protein